MTGLFNKTRNLNINIRPDIIYIQTKEIAEELEKKEVNHYKIIKLLKETFEDLTRETTALGLIEVNNICASITFRPDYFQFPEYYFTLISECLTLHNYPSQLALASPIEILKDIIDLHKELKISEKKIVTKSDLIIQLYEKKLPVNEIAIDLKEDVYYIKRVLINNDIIKSYD